MSVETTVADIRFKALNNAPYHTARRQRLETWSRVTSFLVVMAGTGTVVNMVADQPFGAWLGLLVAGIGAAQLVFDFTGRARTHELLQRRYYDLLGRVHEKLDYTAEECAGMFAEILRISGEEPPTLRALDAVAYNEALYSLYGESRKDYRLKVTAFQSLTRHVLPHNGASFPPLNEHKTEAAKADATSPPALE